jgi:V/A-type H+-transporting ATPase subunit B
LLAIDGVRHAAYGDLVEVRGADGAARLGQVLEISRDAAIVQVFAGTIGLANAATRVRFLGRGLTIPVAREMLGRVFDGLGRPKDGLPPPVAADWRDVNGLPINPCARVYPRDFIQTGVSAIDLMNSLVRGQKLPVFSGNGLPHNRLVAQIIRQARLLRAEEPFAVVFGAMGVKADVARFFIESFERSGVIDNVTLFLSLADDPSVERLVTPRSALTFAEHLAFDLGMHVLVLLTDMTNYCEALREVATARSEIPSRKGYPGYLYSDLASLYERAGRVEGRAGSITQMPVLTMPSDDISHPVPDLTGFITEGQIVLDREMSQRGIYPPVAGLPSLSRLMKDGIGAGRTRADHPHLAAQLFACYSKVKEIRALASVIGEEELSPLDKLYMQFGEGFERRLVTQGEFEERTVAESLDLGWELLKILPRSELYRLSEEELAARFDPPRAGEVGVAATAEAPAGGGDAWAGLAAEAAAGGGTKEG